MKPWPAIVGLVLGVGVGFLPPVSTESAPPEAMAPAPNGGSTPPQRRTPSTNPKSGKKTVRRPLVHSSPQDCGPEVASLLQQLEYDEGKPLAWDESRATYNQPDAVESTLEKAFKARGAELVDLDCSEYPCVAVALAAGDVEELLDPTQPVEDLTILNAGDGKLSDGRRFQVIAVGDDIVQEEADRINIRVEDHLAIIEDFAADAD